MSNISDIAPIEQFETEVRLKYVSQKKHPTLPLDLYNYTPKAQYEKRWNPVTLACRGLIVNRDTKEIVSRCMRKFFNHADEKHVDRSLTTGPVEVTDKLDGSFGITYPTAEGLAIATRGSFISPEALHATALYQAKYAGKWVPKDQYAYIFEIVSPINRIVVDYNGLDDIILLGAVDNHSGQSISVTKIDEWKWSKVEVFPFTTFKEVLSSAPRVNAEGFVIHFLDSDARIKYKYNAYLKLHAFKSDLRPRKIIEMLQQGQDMDAWVIECPDEFHEGINRIITKARADFDRETKAVESAHADLLSTLPSGFDKKTFVAALSAKNDRKMFSKVLMLHEGKITALSKQIWLNLAADCDEFIALSL